MTGNDDIGEFDALDELVMGHSLKDLRLGRKSASISHSENMSPPELTSELNPP
jgi:hypothetical protein